MVIFRLLSNMWNALSPYIGIYLSALVIDELSGNRNPNRLQFLVLLTLTSTALVSLITAVLTKCKDSRNAGYWWRVQYMFSEKLLETDFVNLDNTETSEKLNTIWENQYGGWGVHPVITHFENLCSSIFTILGGLTLTVSLFVNRVPETAGAYTILNDPLFLFLVIAVMLLITYAAPYLSNKAGSYFALNSDIRNLENRLYGFYNYLGYEREIATDVRVYRQDKLCQVFSHNKERPFGTKGIFAKYSRGPIGLYQAASSAVSVVFTGVVYVFVCLKAWAGAFGLGAVTQYVAAITKTSGGVSQFISTLGGMRNNASFLSLIFDFLDMPDQMYQGSLTVEKRRDYDYEVEFQNVSFQYPGSENYALRNVNMKFKIGSRLAVVGMNGSGKTTFIKLLCRLYDPTEGIILLNGIDIRKYNYLDYMGIFSVVFQDFQLLSLKLGSNVASQEDFDPAKARDCLQKAGFGARLDELPKGLNTYLHRDYDKDGITFSGGESQKIAIARALYKNAPFIILDEPTAALDPMAEAEIYNKFNEITGNKTAIYISHRLSSCIFCDEILVFHEGSVIQQGTHTALLADEAGKYYELWQAQAQYYT